jgi:hypothetical protein
MHHLERRGAAIDDDRLAILTERDGFLGNRLLLAGMQALVDTERTAGKADELGLMASAPPRTRRRRFCTCSAAISLRIVASELSVRSTSSGTVMTGLSWTADRIILCRSFSCIRFLQYCLCFHHDRALSITNNHIFSLCSAI